MEWSFPFYAVTGNITATVKISPHYVTIDTISLSLPRVDLFFIPTDWCVYFLCPSDCSYTCHLECKSQVQLDCNQRDKEPGQTPDPTSNCSTAAPLCKVSTSQELGCGELLEPPVGIHFPHVEQDAESVSWSAHESGLGNDWVHSASSPHPT